VLLFSGERTRPRVPFPASRRKTMFGGTPTTTRGTRMLPGHPRNAVAQALIKVLPSTRSIGIGRPGRVVAAYCGAPSQIAGTSAHDKSFEVIVAATDTTLGVLREAQAFRDLK
jgi:hypothetical protein